MNQKNRTIENWKPLNVRTGLVARLLLLIMTLIIYLKDIKQYNESVIFQSILRISKVLNNNDSMKAIDSERIFVVECLYKKQC